MKSTIKTKRVEAKQNYPCLKQFADGTLVYFTEQRNGVCIHGSLAGVSCDGWIEEDMTPFHGKVTLEND